MAQCWPEKTISDKEQTSEAIEIRHEPSTETGATTCQRCLFDSHQHGHMTSNNRRYQEGYGSSSEHFVETLKGSYASFKIRSNYFFKSCHINSTVWLNSTSLDSGDNSRIIQMNSFR